jgi:hypothetical protein
MTEQQHDPAQAPEPVAEWNPLAKIEPVTVPLKVSGGRASIILRRWTGRERLAYEDALTELMLVTDSRGEDTVKIGTMRLWAVSLTVVGCVGFPNRPDGTPLFAGNSREETEQDLLALDPDTFNEIREHALKLQPLPSAAEDEDDPDEGDGEGDLPDPSSTPSTSPTATVDAPAAL